MRKTDIHSEMECGDCHMLTKVQLPPPAVSAPVAVRVKPLEWDDALLGHGISRAKDGLGGYYEVAERSDGFQTCLVIKMGGGFISHHPTLEAAKSAAQADYAARIMAAIDAPDVAELVEALRERDDAMALAHETIRQLKAAKSELSNVEFSLADPVAVHVNMLRGTIAKPTVEQIVHLYGVDALCKALVPAIVREAGHEPAPDVMAELVEALRGLHQAVCGETGFAACVRQDSGKAYPWPALDAAEEAARAALARIGGQ